MSETGESINGTRGGPIAPRPWGVTTHKGNKICVYILNGPDPLQFIAERKRLGRRAHWHPRRGPALTRFLSRRNPRARANDP